MKVELLNYMGSDTDIVNAARVSFSKNASQYTDEQNKNLIYYLARGCSSKEYQQLEQTILDGKNQEEKQKALSKIKNMPIHWTPFSHTALTFRVSAPVSIRTQCFKHKQGLTENEESRRYITTKPEYYIPKHFRAKAQNIKQGSEGKHHKSDFWLNHYHKHCIQAINLYEDMIDDGIAPEQARFVLPQSVEVTWIWTGNLFAFANFYNKRTDSHAQREIQLLAYEFNEIIKDLFPISWTALIEK